MQIKTTLRFQLIPVRMAKIKNTDDSLCCYLQGKGNTPALLMGVQAGTAPNDITTYLKTPTIPLLGIYPKDAQA